METKMCEVCWGVVATRMAEVHDQWHQRIAEVAIDSTEMIKSLTQRVQELEAGYGDL